MQYNQFFRFVFLDGHLNPRKWTLRQIYLVLVFVCSVVNVIWCAYRCGTDQTEANADYFNITLAMIWEVLFWFTLTISLSKFVDKIQRITRYNFGFQQTYHSIIRSSVYICKTWSSLGRCPSKISKNVNQPSDVGGCLGNIHHYSRLRESGIKCVSIMGWSIFDGWGGPLLASVSHLSHLGPSCVFSFQQKTPSKSFRIIQGRFEKSKNLHFVGKMLTKKMPSLQYNWLSQRTCQANPRMNTTPAGIPIQK